MEKQIMTITDCTLRQKNGLPDLSFREKLELCRLIDRLNVDLIEMEEIRQVKIDSLLIKSVCTAVSSSRIAVPVALNEESVRIAREALRNAVHPRLQVPAPVSSVQMEYLSHMKPKAMIAAVADTIRKCREFTDDVEFIAEDATSGGGVILGRTAVEVRVLGGVIRKLALRHSLKDPDVLLGHVPVSEHRAAQVLVALLAEYDHGRPADQFPAAGIALARVYADVDALARAAGIGRITGILFVLFP